MNRDAITAAVLSAVVASGGTYLATNAAQSPQVVNPSIKADRAQEIALLQTQIEIGKALLAQSTLQAAQTQAVGVGLDNLLKAVKAPQQAAELANKQLDNSIDHALAAFGARQRR